jgi:hypothetical protein
MFYRQSTPTPIIQLHYIPHPYVRAPNSPLRNSRLLQRHFRDVTRTPAVDKEITLSWITVAQATMYGSGLCTRIYQNISTPFRHPDNGMF